VINQPETKKQYADFYVANVAEVFPPPFCFPTLVRTRLERLGVMPWRLILNYSTILTPPIVYAIARSGIALLLFVLVVVQGYG
jgi:hypothetical protein